MSQDTSGSYRSKKTSDERRDFDMKAAAVAILILAIIGVIALLRGSPLGLVIFGSIIVAFVLNQVGMPGASSPFTGAAFRSPSPDSPAIRFAASDNGIMIIMAAIFLAMIIVGAVVGAA